MYSTTKTCRKLTLTLDHGRQVQRFRRSFVRQWRRRLDKGPHIHGRREEAHASCHPQREQSGRNGKIGEGLCRGPDTGSYPRGRRAHGDIASRCDMKVSVCRNPVQSKSHAAHVLPRRRGRARIQKQASEAGGTAHEQLGLTYGCTCIVYEESFSGIA
jgi:hypothetical protein